MRIPRTGILNHLKTLAAASVLGLFFYSSASHATLTLVSIAGASNTDLSTTTPIIYAGFAGTCAPASNSSTCDSCTGLSGVDKLFPCNKRNVIPTNRLVVVMTVSDLTIDPSTMSFTINNNTVSAITTPVRSGNSVSFQLLWGDICRASASSGSSDCLASTSGTLSAKYGSETLNFTLRMRASSNTEKFYTDCDDTTPGASGSGFCHFSAFPGDEKIYANDLFWTDGYPATPVSGIEYKRVVFFYEEQLDTDADDAATIARISNASPSKSVSVNKSASPPVSDNRITGLQNDVRYCMIMANEDSTGIISFYTPNTVPATELCADPSKVVGLLDDKSCFIATAAFGSSMAPEVQSFREFRNEFLLTNPLGTAFVKFYYKHSPFYANLISQSPTAKVIVRSVLWPVLFVARASVTYGLGATLFAVSGALALIGAAILQYRRKGEDRGDA